MQLCQILICCVHKLKSQIYSDISLRSRDSENNKGIHKVFQIFVILDSALHEFDNDLCNAIAKKKKININILIYY